LNPYCDEPLSNFAFKFNLSHYTKGADAGLPGAMFNLGMTVQVANIKTRVLRANCPRLQSPRPALFKYLDGLLTRQTQFSCPTDPHFHIIRGQFSRSCKCRLVSALDEVTLFQSKKL
jgi:hypothetical protein